MQKGDPIELSLQNETIVATNAITGEVYNSEPVKSERFRRQNDIELNFVNHSDETKIGAKKHAYIQMTQQREEQKIKAEQREQQSILDREGVEQNITAKGVEKDAKLDQIREKKKSLKLKGSGALQSYPLSKGQTIGDAEKEILLKYLQQLPEAAQEIMKEKIFYSMAQ